MTMHYLMTRRLACLLGPVLLSGPVLAQIAPPAVPDSEPAAAATMPASTPDPVPATVVVEGRRPGPGVWKVSRGGHVMWVFGTYSPLPRKLEWDAARIERLVARSQEVLRPPVAKAHIGFFDGLTALPDLIGIKKNPDGAVLRDVLPPDVHAHWTALKAKYIGADEGIEHYRPVFAAEELLLAGMKRNGLSFGGDVLGKIEDAARKNKVTLSDSGYDVKLDDPRRMVRDFKKSQVDDVACLASTLDTLDVDLETMRVRANAWANGNIAEIRGVDYGGRQDSCLDAVLDSSFVKDVAGIRQMRERLRASWLKAAEKSLATNASTFAVLEMRDVVDAKGYLAALKAKGYAVESPH
ncbi:TraB/GumN family protein [uncultured Massilia sp.]|uniref:TraB/GumN family protein n=1 Tax=uncultured Massilia sp. TaxID=169973 RepID=UPI0025DBA6B1|nr:TraB/GumN family protein [uncultured Massilia sp.]